MSVVQLIQIVAAVIAALLAIGASAAVIYAAFKRAKNEDNNKANRELIDTLKTSNEILRTEKKETGEKLSQATNDIAELRGELRTLKDMPLQSIAQALVEIAKTNQVILQNQQEVFTHMGINGFKQPDDSKQTNNS